MALDPKRSNAAASAAADAFGALLDGGYLRLYEAPKPSTADTATAATLLAELRFGTPAFDPAVNGVAAAAAITDDSDCNATGVAAWFRALASDGSTKIYDGTVDTADADLIVATTSVVQHATFGVSSLSITELK